MPQIDSINTDSTQNATFADSASLAVDTLRITHYWKKDITFYYEYAPFLPFPKNVEKLFSYQLPNSRIFKQSDLFVVSESTIASTQDTVSLSLHNEQNSSDTISSQDTVEVWAEKTFVMPTNFNDSVLNESLTSKGLPLFLKETDSINKANNTQVTVIFGDRVEPLNKTYFYSNEFVKIESVNYTKTNWMERDWLFWPLAALFVFFVLTRYKNRNFINQIVTSVFYSRMSVRIFNERNESTSPVIQSLLFFYFLTAGIFVYMSLNYYKLTISYFNGFVFFVVLSLLFVFLYFLKVAAIKILGYIFYQKKVVREYIHNVKLFNITTGILLLPLSICIPFLNAYIIDESSLIYTGFFAYIVLFILQLLRGFYVSYRQGVSLFYILLYLCVLEIIPFAIIVKIVTL